MELTAVAPSLTVSDLQASLAWYCDVLGFTEVEKYENEGKLMGVRLSAGDVQFLLSQDDFAKGRDRQKGVGLRLYCVGAKDIDALASGIKERGGTLLQELTDQPWGARDFAVEDPDGFKIGISTGSGD